MVAWGVRPSRRRGSRIASTGAFAAAALFVLGLSRFAVGPLTGSDALNDGQPLGAVVAAAPHLVLMIMVWPRWPAPRWVRACGLWWFVLDLVSDALALVGAEPAAFLAVRYLGHLGAVIWIGATSWSARGALRAVGVLTAVALLGGTLGACLGRPAFLAPSGPLLIVWCVLLGRRLRPGRDD